MAAPRGFEDRCHECGEPTPILCQLCQDPVCRRHVGLFVEDAVEIGGGNFIVCVSCCEHADEAVGVPGTRRHTMHQTHTTPPFRAFADAVARVRKLFTRS